MKLILITITLLTLALTVAAPNTKGCQANVILTQNGTSFAYTLFNDENMGSSLYVNNFYLRVNAPFAVVSHPQGWNYLTDNYTYVDWYCADSSEPYQNQLAPGASLSGFVLQSQVDSTQQFNCVIGSWDLSVTNVGSDYDGLIAAPSVFASAYTEIGRASCRERV